MKITIITLFPEIFSPVLNSSILGRAQQKGLVEIELINLRDFGEGPHKTVDDRPYGGGVGMVLKASVLADALKSVGKKPDAKVILTSASGHTYNQARAREFSKCFHLIIVCGHYEGVDQRFIEKYVDEEVSIGNYVLTGGELPAMVLADSVIRLIDRVLEKKQATEEESFSGNLLEYPHYTRPEVFEEYRVPKVLLSGNHQEIANWRARKSEEKTKSVRPDLLAKKG